MTRNNDLHLTAEGRRELFDVFDGRVDPIDDMEAALHEKGWRPFLRLGSSDEIGVEIAVRMRHIEEGGWEYLLNVWGPGNSPGFLKVDDLPTVMELLAKWAPVVQAASIVHAVSDLGSGVLDHAGMVETIAARAAWGAEKTLPIMTKDRDQHAARAWRTISDAGRIPPREDR